MKGYVYIMSNEAMPGIYKIGCTSRHPENRANDLYTTGVPSRFVIEYAIIIENYQYVEKLIHNNLSKHHYNKEFFRCDLKKCILELKSIAYQYRPYKEKYKSKLLKAQVEDREKEYLQGLEEKRRLESERKRQEQERIEKILLESRRKQLELEEEQHRKSIEGERKRTILEDEIRGCIGVLIFVISFFLGLYVAVQVHNSWGFFVTFGIGIYIAIQIR